MLDDTIYESVIGCLQGAKCSPLLWRIDLNDLLHKLEIMNQIRVSSFADDIFLIVYANNRAELDNLLRLAMNKIKVNEIDINYAEEIRTRNRTFFCL